MINSETDSFSYVRVRHKEQRRLWGQQPQKKVVVLSMSLTSTRDTRAWCISETAWDDWGA